MVVSGLTGLKAFMAILAIVAFASVNIAAPAAAQDDGEVLEPVFIELPSMLAPVFSSNGKVRRYLNLAIKIELHPEFGLVAKDVKQYIPRFQDMIVRHTYRTPIPRHPDGDGYWLKNVGEVMVPQLEALFQRIILAPAEEDEEPNPKLVKGIIIEMF